MSTIDFYFLVLVFVAVLVTGLALGFIKYKNFINPISFHLAFVFFVVNMLSLISTVLLRVDQNGFSYESDFKLEHLVVAGWISVLSEVCFLLPFIFARKKTSIKIVETFFPRFLWQGNSLRPRWSHACILFFVTVVSFLLLSYSSEVPYVWISDPRSAYLFYRAGNGHFYLLTVFSLLFCFIVCLFRSKRRISSIVIVTILFTLMSFWTGKKAVIVCFPLIAVIFYHFNIRTIGSFSASVFAFAAFSLVLFLVGGLGAGFDLEMILAYFHYADVSALMLARFDEFGFYLGKVFWTSFWVLVPRALYPEKPFEYGDSLIHAVLFPGLAEQGHTAGLLNWSGLYLDFGLFGVVIGGFVSGLVVKIIFEYYLYRRRSAILFMTMIHFCFWPIWFFLPLVAVFVWLYLCHLFLRVRLI